MSGTIPLSKGMVAIVDDEDYEFLSTMKWHVLQPTTGCFYAETYREGRKITMHSLLLAAPKGREVDHKNADGLDNRRGNLRLATRQQNCRNMRLRSDSTSGFKGVSRDKRNPRRPWVARIKVDGKHTHIGCFPSAEAAARAYDRFAVELFGDFARTNFPIEEAA